MSRRALRVRSPGNLVDGSGRAIVYRAQVGGGGAPAYVNAGRGYRMHSLAASDVGPNAGIFTELPQLVNRSRAAHRNNGYAFSGIEAKVANTVGTGVKPQSMAPEPYREQIDEAFLDWTDYADADDRTDFYGLQELIVRTQQVAGEILCRYRDRDTADGFEIPFQLQLLEGDHLPLYLNRDLENGRRIRAGIETDGIGRRTAYHITRTHPGDRFLGGLGAGDVDTVPVPASKMLHIYQCMRPGQLRGEPALVRSLLRLHNINELDDATLDRQVTASQITGVITGPDADAMEGMFEENAGEGESEGTPPPPGIREVALTPGFMPYLPAGTDIKFADTPGEVSHEFKRDQLHGAAAGMGCTHEQLTWDLRDVNYSSIRAGLIEFRRRCEMYIHSVLVYAFCRRVWSYWMDAAVLAGVLQLPNYLQNRQKYQRVKWVPHGWQYVDPLKEAEATIKLIQASIMSLDEAVSERGGDAGRVMRENAARFKACRDAGLVISSDYSNVAKGAGGGETAAASNDDDGSRGTMRPGRGGRAA